VTSLLDYLNWGGWGINPEVWAVIMLVVAGVIAAGASFTRGDVAYMLVILWAFAGIGVKQGDTAVVAVAAWVMTGLMGLVLIAGAVLKGRRSS
jgi:benzodiazapine receptor